MGEEKRGVTASERLFAGVVLVVIGLLGLGGGMMGGGMMGHMWGYGYSPGFPEISYLILFLFLGITVFGLYIIYTAVRE